jgi:MFS family permease
VLPDDSHLTRTRLDVRGAVLLGVGVAGLLLILSQGRQWGWTSPEVLALAITSPVLLAVWVLHERRVTSPLVDLRLLRHRPVLVADVTALSAGIGIYLMMSSVSWLLQSPATHGGGGFGMSPLVAACAMVPFSITSVATAQLLVPRLVEHVGDAWPMPLGCLVFAAAMLVMALVRDHAWQAYLVMGLSGLGAGCTFSSMPTVIVNAVPAGEVGSATGVNQVLRSIGYATGAASFAAVLAAYADPRSGATAPFGFELAAYLGAAVFGATALLGLLLVGGPGQRAIRHEPELIAPP